MKVVYDRDLKWAGRFAFACALGNVASFLYAVRREAWAVAVVALIWFICCCVWLLGIRSQQVTRDLVALALQRKLGWADREVLQSRVR